jgi:hypothetical protein
MNTRPGTRRRIRTLKPHSLPGAFRTGGGPPRRRQNASIHCADALCHVTLTDTNNLWFNIRNTSHSRYVQPHRVTLCDDPTGDGLTGNSANASTPMLVSTGGQRLPAGRRERGCSRGL